MMLTDQQVMARLRAAVEEAGGQRAFARKHGFTAGYVNDVLRGKRMLADRILSAIGVEQMVEHIVTYREKRSAK